jgi:hypothetical protein
MYEKIESINRLSAMGLNRHNMVISKDPTEILLAALRMDQFTVRTDGKEQVTDLPFYVQEEPLHKEGFSRLTRFLSNGAKRDYAFIIADGIRYDPIQLYNGVVNIKRDGRFMLEISTKKVPLRHMYDGSTFGMIGKLGDRIRDMECIGPYQYPKKELIEDIFNIYQFGIFGKDIEFTRYPIPLGEKKECFVFWQIR